MIYPENIQQKALAIIQTAANDAMRRGCKFSEALSIAWMDWQADMSVFTDEVAAQLQELGFKLD